MRGDDRVHLRSGGSGPGSRVRGSRVTVPY